MTENNGTVTESGRDKQGRFATGNPGRPKGSVGKRVLTARKVVAGQTDALVEKALEMALDGNESMLRLFVSRILPKDGFDTGMKPYGGTPLVMIESLFKQYQQDSITAGDLSGHLQLFKVLFDALELQDFKTRLEVLEQSTSQESKGENPVLVVGKEGA